MIVESLKAAFLTPDAGFDPTTSGSCKPVGGATRSAPYKPSQRRSSPDASYLSNSTTSLYHTLKRKNSPAMNFSRQESVLLI